MPDYSAGAMMEHDADGAHRSFDATVLELFAPPHLRGRALTIYHDAPLAQDSPWRAPGLVLNFTIDADLLAQGMQLFTGAVRDLRVEEARCP